MKDGQVSIKCEIRGTYLYAHLSGCDGYEASINYWTAILEKARELELSRILVHENLKGVISEGEIFDLIQQMLPLATGIKVAFFDEDAAHMETNLLGEMIALNRGGDVQVFKTLKEAEAWITG